MSSTKKKLFQLMGLSLIAYPLGFVNQLLMSNYFGTSAEIDAYWIGMSIVNMMMFYKIPVKEALVPEFYKRHQKNEYEGGQYLSGIGNFLLLIIFTSSLLLWGFPDFFLQIIVNEEQEFLYKTARNILPFLVPLIFLKSATEILNGVLISLNKVIFENLGRIFAVICSISFLVFFADQWQIKALIAAAIIAQLVLFLIQGRELRVLKLHYSLWSKPKTDSHFRKMTGALLLTYAFSQVYIIFERNIFVGFGEGVISAYQYAHGLSQIPQNIIIVSVSAVLWPKFLKAGLSSDYKQIYSLIISTCQRAILLLGFITLFSVMFAEPLIYLLYYRGSFNQDSLWMTAKGFRYIMLGSVPVGISMIMGRALVSLQKSQFLMYIGFSTGSAGLLILLLGKSVAVLEIVFFHFAGASIVGMIVCFYLLNRSLELGFWNIEKKRLYFWFGRYICAVSSLYYLYPIQNFALKEGLPGKLDVIVKLAYNCILLLSAYLLIVVTLRLISMAEIHQAILFLKKRVLVNTFQKTK
jgi:putative peptidoglycan lipid II flippase